ILIGFIAFFPDIDWLMDKIWFKENSLFKKIWFKIFKSKSIHRTFLHNIWVLIILLIVFGYFSNFDMLLILGVFVGYTSHLFLDSLTVSGIYWFWPYGDEKIFNTKKFYKNGNFVTGSLKEKVLFTIFVVIGGLLFGYGFYKMQEITTEDIFQLLIYVVIIGLIGIVFMYKLTQAISRATSKILLKSI
ncbi:MAG: metal-dependent hydrolase, partial [Candidatus Aenigmarchaeota archaeon]|nr:metal-dependent hydrolase [Candidatus Aenigmarchaeota archaeon]MDW8149116.1 metal-dependent hydrolase [Candidatus Aenigmarchaeota archaeon]